MTHMHSILIADDEKPVRIAIAKLAKLDYYHIDRTYFAENGKEALDLFREVSPSLVFIDMNMPILSGTEFLKAAAEMKRHCAFIVISGYDDFSYAQDAIHYGATDYLLKPVSAEDLNAAMGKAMRLLYPNEVFSEDNCTDSSQSAQQVIELLKDTLEKDYSFPFRLQEFADKHFFSKEYLSRLFKYTYGKGISDYLTEIRMHRASDLLKKSDVTISDIAARVGYSDNNYFSKAFRNYYNMTPSEYRTVK